MIVGQILVGSEMLKFSSSHHAVKKDITSPLGPLQINAVVRTIFSPEKYFATVLRPYDRFVTQYPGGRTCAG